MSIEINAEGLDRAIDSMQEILDTLGGKNAAKAVAKALNHSLSKGRRQASLEARKAYTAPIKKLFENISINRASGGNMEGSLEMSGNIGVSLFHFRPNPATPASRPKAGVSSQVQRKGPRYVHGHRDYPNAYKPFIMKKKRGSGDGGFGIFVREKDSAGFGPKKNNGRARGNYWGKFHMLFGPSPIQALQRRDVQERVTNVIEENFEPSLQQEIDKMLAASVRR